MLRILSIQVLGSSLPVLICMTVRPSSLFPEFMRSLANPFFTIGVLGTVPHAPVLIGRCLVLAALQLLLAIYIGRPSCIFSLIAIMAWCLRILTVCWIAHENLPILLPRSARLSDATPAY
jgi:hypothetical protein